MSAFSEVISMGPRSLTVAGFSTEEISWGEEDTREVGLKEGLEVEEGDRP